MVWWSAEMRKHEQENKTWGNFPDHALIFSGTFQLRVIPTILEPGIGYPPIPQFLFQTWPCVTSIVCLNLLSVLTFVRIKFLSLFVEAFLSFSFQDRAFKNVRCYSRVDSPIKSSYGQCSPNIISDNFYINMLSFQNETHSCKNGQNGF